MAQIIAPKVPNDISLPDLIKKVWELMPIDEELKAYVEKFAFMKVIEDGVNEEMQLIKDIGIDLQDCILQLNIEIQLLYLVIGVQLGRELREKLNMVVLRPTPTNN